MSTVANNSRFEQAARNPVPWIIILAPVGAALISAEATRGLIGLTAVLGLLVLGVAVAVMIRCDVIPSRPVDLAVACGVLLLPVVPFLNTLSPIGTLLRYALAGAVMMLIGIGLIPVRRGMLAAGGWLIVVFVALQIVPLVRAEASVYGLLRAANWVMFVPFAFIDYDARARRITLAAGIGAGLLLCFGVVLQILGVLPGAWGGLPLSDGAESPLATRYTSFVLNPNDLGLYLLGISVALYVFSRHQHLDLAARVSVLSGVAMCAAFLLLSASRGAILAAPIVILFLIAIGDRRTLTHFAVVSACALVIVLLIPPLRASAWTTIGSLGSVLTGDDVSIAARIDTWNRWMTSDTNLLIGSGYGGYAAAAQFAGIDISAARDRAELYRALTVDNSWLKLWLEQGLLGIIAFTPILVGAVVRCFRSARSHWSPATATIGALLVAIGFRAASVDFFDINPWNFILWLLIGLSFSAASVPASSQPSFQKGSL